MSDDETTVETLIIDGERKYVCNTCSSINRLVTGKTKCKTCGAWYQIDVIQIQEGIPEPDE
jgi:predicted ATP-dependent serine protease